MTEEKPARAQSTSSGSIPSQLETTERHLWRVSLLFLALLATALAVTSWERLKELPTSLRLEGLPLGVFVLGVLFAAYVWHKRRELDHLRGFVKALQEREQAPPSEQQLQKLTDVLIRSQQGYRELIDSFNDMVFALGLDGEIRAANRQFAETFSLTFPELVGHRLDEFLDEPKPDQAAKELARFLERRQWTGMVKTRLKRNGAVRYFDCILHPILKDGEVVGISGIARDVTQLRESETRFSELFETLQEGVYFTTPDGKLLDANPALVRMLGYESKDELLGINVNDLYWNPSERPVLLRELEESNIVRAREITLRRKDGKALVCLDTSTAMRDPLGRVVRYQGTLLDITHRREMEKRLHEEQEFARRMVECFPDSIVVLDIEGRYTYVSPRITEQLGFMPEDLMGKYLGERTDPEDRQGLLDLFHEIVAGKRTYSTTEYRTQHKNGNWRLFRATASPLFDTAGRITGMVASARDITEVKQLERQVTQSEKLAAMGQMIAGVAHELNNPLTAILGVTDLLRERAKEDGPRRQLELAHQQARRAAEIVQNLLAFARPPAPRKGTILLNDLVRRTLHLQEHALKADRVAVEFVPGTDLAPVIGDLHQLMQVFVNLIVNAIQAIREVRDHGTLRVRSGQHGGRVWMSFQDDGPGIKPDTLPRIFDPFFTTKRPGKGTGLGLSICLAILKEHGGSIDAQAPPMGGAIFTVYLPAAQPSPPVAKPDPAALGKTMAGHSVLVVEDEESIRELVKDGLADYGLEVHSAARGEEAVRMARERAYHVVVCDLKMPGMSGEEVYELIGKRADGSAQPFVFITGDSAEEETAAFLARVGAPTVEKPFKVSDLAVALKALLEPLLPEPTGRGR